jgi:hypothetical protein
MRSFTVAAAAATLFASASAIDPIVIKGSKFFYKTNGTQFFMKGVAYQQEINTNTTQTKDLDYTDPLADINTCKRDIKQLVDLKTNTIRVYAVDPTKDHDECMKALADAGIYVIADLSQPGESINRNDAQWNVDLYKRYTSVVDILAKYDNTLGFFAGNEVSNQINNTMASAFVKAAVRDTKAYIKSKNYRQMGVGYATNDDAEIRDHLSDYFNCGPASDSIDFWGYNIYSWCGDSSFKKSGFDVRTEQFKNYNVPVFFAEYGCNTPRPRLFTEVQSLYGPDMVDVWSGGIVYMYFEEENKYGLVEIENGEVKTNKDYENLKKQISKVNPKGVKMSEYNPTNTKAAECPDVGDDWEAVSDPLPPVANAEACDCMMDTLSCVVSDRLSEDSYGELFGVVCGYNDGEYCAGINRNTTNMPDYGAYGMCTPKQQLSFALNQYSNANENGCDFEGQAKTQTAKSSTPSNCKSLLDEAGEDGTGTLTGPANGGSASSKPSSGAAAGLSTPGVGAGVFGLGAYVAVAMVSGMALVFM